MPREKRPAAEQEEAEPRDLGSAPATKKSKSGEEVEVGKNEAGESFINLSEYRRVTVRMFKGKVLVDVREMYKDKSSGAMKPGNKGISLTREQWQILKSNADVVDELIGKAQE
nr:hypothetical protein L204_03176 [Cryptococcus depauperatus CBS 7855]